MRSVDEVMSVANLYSIVSSRKSARVSFCLKVALRNLIFQGSAMKRCGGLMVKPLSGKGHRIMVLVQQKWKSWNITVIQADSGGSRTSVDGAAQGSRREIAAR